MKKKLIFPIIFVMTVFLGCSFTGGSQEEKVDLFSNIPEATAEPVETSATASPEPTAASETANSYDVIEGEFVDDEYFPNWISISWNEDYSKADVLISIYRQMGYKGYGYMEDGVLKITIIPDDDSFIENDAIFYKTDSGYELKFTNSSLDYVPANEPYTGFYPKETKEETSETKHLEVSVYSNSYYERDGALILVGTVSDDYFDDEYTDGDEIEMYFYKDTVLEDIDSLDQAKEGDDAISWLKRLEQSPDAGGLTGVYEVYMTDGHVDKVVGLYWWD